MQNYSILREFADSWMLLVLFGVFVAMLAWVFRPGSRQVHAETASSPFRNDDAPARQTPEEAEK